MLGESGELGALTRLAFGEPPHGGASAGSLHKAGLERLALAELRRVVGESPEYTVGWMAVLDFFLAEKLPFSAFRVLNALDSRGHQDLVSASVREWLARFSAVPPISLYVPCFNAVLSLPLVLESVRAQSLRPAQIIVVDDCSTDSTAEVAARFDDVELIRHDVNRGVGATRNTALAAARHPLIASLDSDVIADEFWLERLVVAMVESPLVGVFGALVERNAVRLPDRWRARVMPLLYPGEGDIDDAVLFGSNTLFTAAALRAVGGYDPRYTRAFDDTDLGNKLRAAGLHIRYVHRAVCEHTRQDTLQAVLKSCYAYRKERAIKDRLFEQVTTLEARWNTIVRDGIAEIEELHRTGASSVVFPSLLNIFWTIACDLGEFLRVDEGPIRRRYAAAVLSALDRAVGELPGVSESVGCAIRTALTPVRMQLGAAVEKVAVSNGEVTELYERSFSKLSAVLHFSPAVRSALESGARESLALLGNDSAHGGRVAIVECGYLLGDTGTTGVRSFLDTENDSPGRATGIERMAFDRSIPLREIRQRVAALKGYLPTRVLIVAVNEGASRIARALLQLRESCGDGVPVTVAGTSVPLENITGVEFSVEPLEKVIRRFADSR